MKKFRMYKPDLCDKSFNIYNDEITLTVDYDDVDHPAVRKAARRILEALNNYDDLKFRMDGLEK